MSELPDLTMMLGPPTRLSIWINDLARVHRWDMPKLGLRILPTRLSKPVLQTCLDATRTVEDREAELAKTADGLPLFLAHHEFLGGPNVSASQRSLMAGAVETLGELAKFKRNLRIVLTVDPLHEFLFAAKTEKLSASVRATPWEVLYALNWLEFLEEVALTFPEADLLVLTGRGAASNPVGVLRILFGPAAEAVPNSMHFLTNAVNETGQAVLARLSENEGITSERCAEVYANFAVRPSPDELQEVMGIERVTAALLQQRFEEDLDGIRNLPWTQVV